MKKILMLICSVSMVGCACGGGSYAPSPAVRVYQTVERVPVNRYSANVYYGRYYRGPSSQDLIQQEMNQHQIDAAQMNEMVSGVMGPNRYSGRLLNYQNRLRETNARMQNPWLQYFSDSNCYGPRY